MMNLRDLTRNTHLAASRSRHIPSQVRRRGRGRTFSGVLKMDANQIIAAQITELLRAAAEQAANLNIAAAIVLMQSARTLQIYLEKN